MLLWKTKTKFPQFILILYVDIKGGQITLECFKVPNCKQIEIWISHYDSPPPTISVWNRQGSNHSLQYQSAESTTIMSQKANIAKLSLYETLQYSFSKLSGQQNFMRLKKKKKKGDESSWKCFREQRLFIQYLTTLWFHKTGHSPALCGGLIPVRLRLWLTEIKAEELCSITISLEQSNAYSHSRSTMLIFTAGHVTWRCITTVVDTSRRSAVKDGAAGDWSPTSLNITFIL